MKLKETITCPVCRAEKKMLGAHMLRVHGMTAEETKQNFGLESLTAPATLFRIARADNFHNRGVKLGRRAPRVIVYCAGCGKSKEIYFSALKQNAQFFGYSEDKKAYLYMCRECFLEDARGKHRPEEVRSKISKSKEGIVFSEEHKKNLSLSKIGKYTGENSPSYGRHCSEETKAKLRAANIGKVVPSDVIEKMSIGMAKRLSQLPRRNARFKTGYFESEKFGKSFFYRSSFEEKALSIFEALPIVTDVEGETSIIPYKRDGVTHNYVVDFCIQLKSGEKILVEVKPEYMLSDPINVLKFCATIEYVREHNLGFCVLTEVELTNINSVETKLMEAIPSAMAANLKRLMI
jgi:hypothetical protein